MNTQWILTHTHNNTTTNTPCRTEREATNKAATLPGITEITCQYTLGPDMDPHAQKLLNEAIQAHHDYHAGVEALKEARRQAFKRAIYGSVPRETLGEGINLSPRTISHIISGK